MVNFIPFLTSLWFTQSPIVNTEYGKIEGYRYVTSDGFATNMFMGIPYAKPPINELRFEKPQPPTPWTDTLNASTFGSKCAAFPDLLQPNGSEDCLTLNIVAPTARSLNPFGYPVLLWIHGGGFHIGGSSDYNHSTVADRIVSRGIIFVSINYRLSSLGFFSTGDSNAPGNYGLWDQVESLKFVQKVIKKFGGNPKAVTIWGQSAGAQSASWLTMSPHTEGLFLRSIESSGSALAIGAASDDILVPSAQLAQAAGCGNAANKKECLKGKSLQEIKDAIATFANYTFIADTPKFVRFHPRFDGEFLYASTMEKSIKMAPKRDTLIGLLTLEWNRFMIGPMIFFDPLSQYYPVPASKVANYSKEDFSEAVHFLYGTTEAFGNKSYEAAEKIIAFYETQKGYYSRNIYLNLFAQLVSDTAFDISSLREAREKAGAHQKLFFYLYNFLPSNLQSAYFDGVPHVTDLMNFFGSVLGFTQLPVEGDVAKVQKTMLDLFLNFVKYGQPFSGNLFVPPVNGRSVTKYVEIKPISQIKNNLWTDRLYFWDKLAKDYGYDWIQGFHSNTNNQQ